VTTQISGGARYSVDLHHHWVSCVGADRPRDDIPCLFCVCVAGVALLPVPWRISSHALHKLTGKKNSAHLGGNYEVATTADRVSVVLVSVAREIMHVSATLLAREHGLRALTIDSVNHGHDGR
jgi:hypothetical protein